MQISKGNHNFRGLKLDCPLVYENPSVEFGLITGTAGNAFCDITSETGGYDPKLSQILIHTQATIGFRENYREGEINEIVDRVGDQLILSEPLRADYINAKIWGRQKQKMDIRNLEVDNIDSNYGIILDGLSESDLFNVRGKGNDVGIAIRRCKDIDIRHCQGRDGGASVSLNYGMSITNSTNVKVNKGTYHAVRHGITTGGGVDPSPLCRDIEVSYATISATGNVGAMDLHGNIDGAEIHHNTIDGGMKVAGRNTHWHDNHVTINETAVYPTSYAAEMLTLNHTMEDNILIHLSGQVPSSRATFFDFGGNNLAITEETQGGNLIIRNNTMTVNTQHNFGIRVFNRGSIADLVVTAYNNIFTDVVANTPVRLQSNAGSEIQAGEIPL